MGSDAATILLIEDDRTLALGLELNLSSEGYRVLLERDGAEGLRRALAEEPDLIVLDMMLPGLDGLEVLAELRRRGREIPVVALTARGETEDKVRGLAAGADDYLTKPFSVRELSARIRAALRRPSLSRSEERHLVFGDIDLDLTARRVERGGEEVALTPREYELLAWLAEHAGEVHSRERLLEAVWHLDYEGTDRTVDNFIRSLRVKLEDDPTDPRHIVTVRGGGYRLDAHPA